MKLKDIENALISELIQAPVTEDALNDARTALTKKIEKKLEKLDWWGVGDNFYNYSKSTWGGVVNDDSKPRDNFQVHVCKWSKIKDMASPRRVKYKSKIRKVKDSGGKLGDKGRQQYPDDGELNRVANSYLYQLFRAKKAPLSEMAELLDQIEKDYRDHRVVVSVDFYYSRPLTQLGLHKDTTGNTLFVGLHYNNDETIAGPEYIYDFWPKPKKEERYHSPWSLDGNVGKSYWPEDLVEGLELARGKVKEEHWDNRDLQHDTTMSKNGLVTFVDELIFHVTPLTRKRTKTEKTADDPLFREVNINSITYELAPLIDNGKPKLRRTLSTKDVLDVGGTGTNGRRSFIRFWVMVEPKAWHVGG